MMIPRFELSVETGNNEDWIDIIQYYWRAQFLDYMVPDEQIDLRAFTFDMHLRREPRDREIIVEATTINQRLSIGAEPNIGTLCIYVPEHVMEIKIPGEYVGDIRARTKNFTRVIMNVTLTLRNGLTRLAFPH
jgi:hypothetical protein